MMTHEIHEAVGRLVLEERAAHRAVPAEMHLSLGNASNEHKHGDAECWCGPMLFRVNQVTGVRVYLHWDTDAAPHSTM